MMQAYEEMNADYEQNMADEAELSDEIAKSEAAYYAAFPRRRLSRSKASSRKQVLKLSSSSIAA